MVAIRFQNCCVVMFSLTPSLSGIAFASYFRNKYWIRVFSIICLISVQAAVPRRISRLPAAVAYCYTC